MKEGSEVGRALPCRGGGAGHMEGRLRGGAGDLGLGVGEE